MTALPLLDMAAPHAPLVYGSRPLDRTQIVGMIQAVAAQLPDARFAINLCQDRRNFMIGFAAACLRSQTSLLPPNLTTGALDSIASDYPDHFRLDDETIANLLVSGVGTSASLPLVDGDQVVAICFTSGSTGRPTAHASTWRTLVGSARRSAAGIFQRPGLALAATVPPQHMFGLETTILQPLFNQCAIHGGRPFFPADIAAALDTLPSPRVLITTPTHLRACVAAATPMPQLDFVLSATAPLPAELAMQVEHQWRTRVLEIYGSTETGAIATRRTTDGPLWTVLPGGSITIDDGIALFRSNGTGDIRLHDSLVDFDGTRFRLAGRDADLIKVAGKRASLTDLNARLLAVPGVRDGVMFQPNDDGRVAALVVAQGVVPREILAALSAHLDEVFLPRPLRIVKALPRDSLGKLPRAQLLAALDASDEPA